jgi:hypothetical protein
MSQQDSLCQKCGLLSWSGHRCAASLEGEEHMTRDDIIKMAREAGIKQAIETPHLLMVHELQRFAALVAAHERESVAASSKRDLTCVCGAVWEGEHMVHAPIQQEPVAWMYERDSRKHLTFTDQRFVEQAHPHFNKSTPLYTAPPKQWVGLTDDEVEDIYFDKFSMSELVGFARSIEQALKDKNGGEYRNKATTERTKLKEKNT